jgi:hypothetical protein
MERTGKEQFLKIFPTRHWWLMPIILTTWEAEIRRITIQGQLRQIVQESPISKITRAIWTGDEVQAVECLLCKCKSLSSNPSPLPQTRQYFSVQCSNLYTIWELVSASGNMLASVMSWLLQGTESLGVSSLPTPGLELQ